MTGPLLPWDDPAVRASAARKMREQGLRIDDTLWERYDFTDDEWVFLEWCDIPAAIERRKDQVRQRHSYGLMQVIQPSWSDYSGGAR